MKGFGQATDTQILYTLARKIKNRWQSIAIYTEEQIALRNSIFAQLDCIIENAGVDKAHPKVVEVLKKYSPKKEADLLGHLGFADTAIQLFDLYGKTFVVVRPARIYDP